MPVYRIKSFRGGISDEEDKGIRGSFKFGQGLDIHKKIDSLSCQQVMKKESGTIVTDLILFIVPCSDGNSYHFGDTGKIYKRTSAGVWSLVYTDTNGKIKGAEEWNGYLYWATDTNLARKPIPGATDWSDAVPAWQTTLTSVDWHSMLVGAGVQGALFICNKDKLAMVGYDGSFTSEAVKIIPNNITKCLISNDEDLIFGSVKADNAEEGYLWAWNTLLLAWKKRKKISVKGVNALTMTEAIFAQAGSDGEIFFSDLVNTLPIIAFYGGGQVNPGAATNKGNLAIFGVYGSSNPGIYSYGRTRKNRVFALNLDYILTPATITEIGAVKMVGSDLLVSWKSGTTYGVDVIDTANKATAIYESLDFDADSPERQKIFTQVKLVMKSLPTGCSVKVKYRVNKGNSFVGATLGDGTETFNIEGATEAIFNTGNEGYIYEVRVELYPSGNTTPEILSVNNIFDFK